MPMEVLGSHEGSVIWLPRPLALRHVRRHLLADLVPMPEVPMHPHARSTHAAHGSMQPHAQPLLLLPGVYMSNP